MQIKKLEHKVYITNENNEEVGYVIFDFEKENVVNISKTFVDESLRGQGAASKLMQAAYEQIKLLGYKATLSCSYAISWFDKHQECRDILL